MIRIATAALAVFVLDQVTKAVVLYALALETVRRIDVVPPFLNLRMAWNEGVNFGIFGGVGDWMRWVLIALALAISAAVWVWAARPEHGTRGKVAAGLLVGGAIGNAVDRVIYGAVADFLNMSCCGFDNPFAFNVADVAIFAGALGLVLWSDGKPAGTKTP